MRVVVLALLVACAVSGAAVRSSQDPRFRSGTDAVSIYATVLGRDGRLVRNLSGRDFRVFDNGIEQKLTVFANEVQPITVVLMIDRSDSIREKFELVQDAAHEFIRLMLPEDRARIGSFSETIQIDPETFTSDQDHLDQLLVNGLQTEGPTPLWNATSAAMDALADQSGRRVVLLFTDGKDAPDFEPGNTTFDQIRARTEVEDVMVYAVGLASSRCVSLQPPSPVDVRYQRRGRPRLPAPGLPGPIGGPPPMPRIPPRIGGTPTLEPRAPAIERDKACYHAEPDPHLKTLADVGGGGYFELENAENLRSTFTRIADELHHQYVLGYPVPDRDGKVHHVEVRMRSDGLSVRARKSYLAPVP